MVTNQQLRALIKCIINRGKPRPKKKRQQIQFIYDAAATAPTSRSQLHAVLAAPPSCTECTETPYSTKNPHTITLVQVVKQVSRV